MSHGPLLEQYLSATLPPIFRSPFFIFLYVTQPLNEQRSHQISQQPGGMNLKVENPRLTKYIKPALCSCSSPFPDELGVFTY